MTTKKATVNLDDVLAEKFGKEILEQREIPTYPIQLFGEEFRVLAGQPVVNLQAIFNANDRGASARLLRNMIHEEDQERFVSTLEAHPALRGDDAEQVMEVLMAITNALLEVASGGHPTISSSGSSRSIPKKAASKRSAAS